MGEIFDSDPVNFLSVETFYFKQDISLSHTRRSNESRLIKSLITDCLIDLSCASGIVFIKLKL